MGVGEMNEYAHANTKALAKDEVPELGALGREERACDEKRRGRGDREPEVAHVEEPSEGQAWHEDHGVLGVALNGGGKGESNQGAHTCNEPIQALEIAKRLSAQFSGG